MGTFLMIVAMLLTAVGLLYILYVFLSTPRWVRDLRRRREAEPRRIPMPHPEAPEREFHVQAPIGVRIVLWLLAVVEVTPGALLLIFGANAETRWFGAGMVGIGAPFTWLAWRYPRLRVRTSPDGIEMRAYFHTVRMAWDEVIAVDAIESKFYGQHFQTTYRIFSTRNRFTINEKWPERDALLDQIAAHASITAPPV